MIPEEAVEAAYRAINYPDQRAIDYDEIKIILEAAAPYLMAQAWDEGRDADDFEVSIGFDRNPYRSQ